MGEVRIIARDGCGAPAPPVPFGREVLVDQTPAAGGWALNQTRVDVDKESTPAGVAEDLEEKPEELGATTGPPPDSERPAS